ncbi:hypothetical protein GGF46_002315 [Coemansia sp. RSA 552]|nr:hypothetical protein GGF46_002315 [Coemansia sp. RSA 552]
MAGGNSVAPMEDTQEREGGLSRKSSIGEQQTPASAAEAGPRRDSSSSANESPPSAQSARELETPSHVEAGLHGRRRGGASRAASAMYLAFLRLPPFQRLKALVMTLMAYIQATGIVVLALSARAHETSDRPLQAFIILYIARLFLYYPLYLALLLRPEWAAGSEDRIKSWVKGAVYRNPPLRLRKFFEVSSLVLFICGCYWVLSSKTAQSEAPLLYYTALTYIILCFVYLGVPPLVVILVIFAFAFFYLLDPSFRMRVHKKKGADFGQISQIPLVRYVCPDLGTHVTSVSSPPSLHGNWEMGQRQSTAPGGGAPEFPECEAARSTASLHSGSSRRRHGLSRIHILNPFARVAHRMTRSKRQRAAEMELYNSQLAGPVPDFTPQDTDDRMCAICLGEYEDGDVLRLLPCSHHMHQSCVDEWLHINHSCPLCKQSVVDDGAKTQSTDAATETEPPEHGCQSTTAPLGQPTATTATTIALTGN